MRRESASSPDGAREIRKPQICTGAHVIFGAPEQKKGASRRSFLSEAIERDSSFADAYAGLADAYLTSFQLGLAGSSTQNEIYTRIKWVAQLALALDEESADAHTLLASALW